VNEAAVSTSPAIATPLIEFRQVTKRFDAVVALQDVSFTVQPGEFLALCGENGAGKSTLMKILSGVITDYAGELRFQGTALSLRGPRDAERAGISMIHQELSLVAALSATANIYLGRERRRFAGWLDEPAMHAEAQRLFQQLDCDIAPQQLVGELRIGDQQLVEIAKALSLNSRLLIMDEPTSALTETEVERLFRIIARLREQGVTIIYISHKMDEVFRQADRITVLRDGQVVATRRRADTTPQEITRLMVGRELPQLTDRQQRPPGEPVLQVTDLSLPWPGHARQWRLKDISFTVHRGEVVGVAGLMGAGRTELLEAISGNQTEPVAGSISLQGRNVRFNHPAQALRAGVALVTEDRKRFGIIPPMNVRQHITLSNLWAACVNGLIAPQRERLHATQAIDRLHIKTAGTEALISSLSGGNQQKCLIARALATSPQLLLLDDPTRGIDVGAKSEIYRLIDQLCQQGLAILLTSSELPELMLVCDRILVLCEGRLMGHFARHEFSEQRLIEAATDRTGSALKTGPL
jgi:ribose transport system ATP-binding protein